jgi:hypothetical protein
MDYKIIRDEEEHHQLSSCPIPEFSTMATGEDEAKHSQSRSRSRACACAVRLSSVTTGVRTRQHDSNAAIGVGLASPSHACVVRQPNPVHRASPGAYAAAAAAGNGIGDRSGVD